MRPLILLAIVLVGCISNAPPEPERPELEFVGFQIETTPFEPFEQAGDNHVGYAGELVGFYASNEDAMPRYAIIAPGGIYTSDFLMGWTEYADIKNVEALRSWRYDAWDIRGLVERGTYDGEAFQGKITVRGTTSDYVVTVDPWIIDGDFEPEIPYTLTPEPVTLPFPLRVPNAMTLNEQSQPNELSRDNHVQIIQWLQAYAEQNAGGVPDEVTPSALTLQRLGSPWPINPFDGQGLANREESGHFTWKKCSAGDAIYLGYAWDGSPIGESFGSGCKLQSNRALNL